MCFQLEKLMKEHSEKLSDADKAPLEAAIKKTRDVAQGVDTAAIKAAISELEGASHAFSKTLYESGVRAGAAGAGAAPGANGGAKAGDEETIDAKFEVKE
jgi:molecular chaperone DnaK